MQQKFYLAFR